MKNSRVALAFVSGYLFGRGHRGTLVLGLAGLAAGKRISSGISPPGAQQLKSSELGRLGQEIGSRLVSAGREAAMSAVSNRMDALSDRLEQRAATLRTGGAGDREPEAGEHGEPEENGERGERERTGRQRKPADRPAQTRKRTGSENPARRSQR
ncbi:hypothetical protein [Streptomyces rapamycinicus]|uniref:Uncharacterized protein n=2 Tax=Streptomyces rapamycinicus TaxID=1226757 RepID=A0A0A0N415_STRRN|nr:hypothetical protein [Streptomyces rapamycinicus]AGP53072.1 hypothetical protein M271_07255 [Streptomyces rapamycinicus NRRL 5491]MBB4780553.1 hypothetical protein [Streptomyces rapamycinicus]RLV74796.1 hypothetical protein D3C57_136260 [Streptomyces rapamycinicus NRRL 5491]UTO61269.1 hypothetical protein LJB45_02290 [Streptomyces rapamycinicus]UTP29215.1 hypothetical protein LIV37_07410 [Streptomyces rapamycinicus NRRL 5491]